jgi:hypothetical protein
MRAWLVAWLVVATPAVARAGFVETGSADPHTGIHVETWQDASLPAVAHLVQIDLTSADIDLTATAPANAGITVGVFSTLESAAVAIDGDSFAVEGYVPEGLAMGQAMPWLNTADNGSSAVFDFRGSATPTAGEYTLAEIVPSGLVVTFATLPTGTLGVVSGKPLLVRDGQAVTSYDCNDPVAIACQAAPRSALALSSDGNTLTLVVVDGWQAASAGVTDVQLAQFLVARGAYMALALDSGSSSTLVLDGALASSPSDGVQVPVANHLGVTFSTQKNGGLIGLVCDKTISPCNTPIDAATVTLDTGATMPTDTNGVYQFANLTPRYTCATAKKTGYYPQQRCVVVGPGPNPTYDSIALQPCPTGGCAQPDAGVIDAPTVYPDATVGDAGGRDGGNAETGGGHGGCCNAGDRPSFLLAALVAWYLVRRRGTTVLG